VRLAAFIAALLACSVARADTPDREWYVGTSLRSDYGAHRVRLCGGARFGRLAGTLIIDPKVYVDDKQNDTDALVEWQLWPDVWAAFAGWRVSQISIDRGVQYQHETLLGMFGDLPRLIEGRVRVRFGVELQLTTLRHGAGTETEVLQIASQRHFRDLVSFNFSLRLELASPL
jgi:hypothetical protein